MHGEAPIGAGALIFAGAPAKISAWNEECTSGMLSKT
jgi:hypothetical protein